MLEEHDQRGMLAAADLPAVVADLPVGAPERARVASSIAVSAAASRCRARQRPRRRGHQDCRGTAATADDAPGDQDRCQRPGQRPTRLSPDSGACTARSRCCSSRPRVPCAVRKPKPHPHSQPLDPHDVWALRRPHVTPLARNARALLPVAREDLVHRLGTRSDHRPEFAAVHNLGGAGARVPEKGTVNGRPAVCAGRRRAREGGRRAEGSNHVLPGQPSSGPISGARVGDRAPPRVRRATIVLTFRNRITRRSLPLDGPR